MWGLVIRLGIVAVGAVIAACSSEKTGKDDDGDGSIDPLGNPTPEDTTPPKTPRDQFGGSTPEAPGCFPRPESFQVIFEMKDAFHRLQDGTKTTPAEGCFSMAVDRETLCFTGETCADGLPQAQKDYLAGGTAAKPKFVAKAKWVSMPFEFFTSEPGDDGYGLMAVRTKARADGDPLKELRVPTSATTTMSWGSIYPDYQNTMGFVWPVEGEFDPATCHLTMTLKTTVKTVDGYGETLPYVAIPYYTQHGALSCVAKPDFSNEGLLIHHEPIKVDFTAPDEPVTVCEGTCTDSDGESNPGSIKATFTQEPFATPTDPIP